MGFVQGCLEEKTSLYHRLCFELLRLDTCNLEQILTMIITINYCRSPFSFTLISMRGMTLWVRVRVRVRVIV